MYLILRVGVLFCYPKVSYLVLSSSFIRNVAFLMVYFSWQECSDSYTMMVGFGRFKMIIPFLAVIACMLRTSIPWQVHLMTMLRFSVAFYVIGLLHF